MSTKNKTAIELMDIQKEYQMGDNIIHVLKGISFKAEKGIFISIVGKSGSGKTTLVNQIGCLDTPSKGSVILDGENVSNLTESNLAVVRGKKIGYVFQQFNLIKNLTAEENVMLPMMLQNVSLSERRERARELLREFDMGERINFKPSELSGGQQQRVAIARALANDPEIILADEPTGNLDSKTSDIVFKYLLKLHDMGKTIILVTHDDALAEEASERILTLVDGNIISDVNVKKNKKNKK